MIAGYRRRSRIASVFGLALFLALGLTALSSATPAGACPPEKGEKIIVRGTGDGEHLVKKYIVSSGDGDRKVIDLKGGGTWVSDDKPQTRTFQIGNETIEIIVTGDKDVDVRRKGEHDGNRHHIIEIHTGDGGKIERKQIWRHRHGDAHGSDHDIDVDVEVHPSHGTFRDHGITVHGDGKQSFFVFDGDAKNEFVFDGADFMKDGDARFEIKMLSDDGKVFEWKSDGDGAPKGNWFSADDGHDGSKGMRRWFSAGDGDDHVFFDADVDVKVLEGKDGNRFFLKDGKGDVRFDVEKVFEVDTKGGNDFFFSDGNGKGMKKEYRFEFDTRDFFDKKNKSKNKEKNKNKSKNKKTSDFFIYSTGDGDFKKVEAKDGESIFWVSPDGKHKKIEKKKMKAESKKERSLRIL